MTQTQYYGGANYDNVALYRGISHDFAWPSLSKMTKDHPEIELKYLPPYQRKLLEGILAEGDLETAQKQIQALGVQASARKKRAEQKASKSENASETSSTPAPGPTLSEEEQQVVALCGIS